MSSYKEKGTLILRRWNRDFSKAPFIAFIVCLVTLIPAGPSVAQTVTDIYNFTGNAGDGFEPSVPMIVGSKGVFYDTTLYGGRLSCGGAGVGCGTVFRLTPSDGKWIHSTIYEFQGGKDGLDSYSTLALDRAGRLYGVTDSGTFYGAIYRLVPSAPGQTMALRLAL